MKLYATDNVDNDEKLTNDVKDAGKVADDYLTSEGPYGLWVTPSNKKPNASGQATSNTTGWHISDALELFKNGVSHFWAGLVNSVAQVRVGLATAGHIIMSGEGYVDVKHGDTVMAHFGYDAGSDTSGDDSTNKLPYYTLGTRRTTTSQFSTSSSYQVGDLCIYNGKEYVCRKDKSAGNWSHTYFKLSVGNYSVGEGDTSVSAGYGAHAEGRYCFALGTCSHAEGYNSYSLGVESHAEGYQSVASNDHSHAEGESCEASGFCSHAEGYDTHALYGYSHAGGRCTKTSVSSQTVIGKFNADNSNALFIVGNGTSTSASNRSNSLASYSNGDLRAEGDIYAGCSADSTGGTKLSGVGFGASGNLLRVEILYISGNNAANTIKMVTPTVVTGYSVVGIVGWGAVGDFPPGETIYELSYNSTNNQIRIGWREAIPTSVGVNVYLLYVKS